MCVVVYRLLCLKSKFQLITWKYLKYNNAPPVVSTTPGIRALRPTPEAKFDKDLNPWPPSLVQGTDDQFPTLNVIISHFATPKRLGSVLYLGTAFKVAFVWFII